MMVFHLASISIFCFMSLARLMVVLYPFESRFKRHKFVSQCVFIGVSLLILVSVCFCQEDNSYSAVLPIH